MTHLTGACAATITIPCVQNNPSSSIAFHDAQASPLPKFDTIPCIQNNPSSSVAFHNTQASPLPKFNSTKDKADEDELDAAEAFERMQLTALSAADPDSAAYHAARKHTSTLRMSGNFKGSKAAA
eukprot:scaffold293145_cov17-Tisochrysis_lutea.AAC.1